MDKKFNYIKNTGNSDKAKKIDYNNIPWETSGKDSKELKVKIGNSEEANAVEKASFKKQFGIESINKEIEMLEADIAVIDAKLQAGGNHLDGITLKKLKNEKSGIEKQQKETADHLMKNPEDEEGENLIHQLKVFKIRREKLEMLLDSDIPMLTPEAQDELIEQRKKCLDDIDILKRTKDHLDSKLN